MHILIGILVVAIIIGSLLGAKDFGGTVARGVGCLIFLFIGIIIIFFILSESEENAQRVKNANRVMVYSDSKLSKILKEIKKGDTLEGICKLKNCIKVDLGKQSGFILTKDSNKIVLLNLEGLQECFPKKPRR